MHDLTYIGGCPAHQGCRKFTVITYLRPLLRGAGAEEAFREAVQNKHLNRPEQKAVRGYMSLMMKKNQESHHVTARSCVAIPNQCMTPNNIEELCSS